MSMILEMGEWYVGSDLPEGRYRFSCRKKPGVWAHIELLDKDGDIDTYHQLDFDEGETSCVLKVKNGQTIKISNSKVKIEVYNSGF